MEKHSDIPRPKPTLDTFRELASKEQWDVFDDLAREVSNDQSFIGWTANGLVSENVTERDLALTLLENTGLPLFDERKDALLETRDNDKNPHLRRKAAIALFRHGDTSDETVERLREAYDSDSELKAQVGKLLGLEE